MVLGKLDISMPKNEDGPLFYTTQKISSKWISLSIRPEIIKLLEENIGEKLHKIGLGYDFLGMTP